MSFITVQYERFLAGSFVTVHKELCVAESLSNVHAILIRVVSFILVQWSISGVITRMVV